MAEIHVLNVGEGDSTIFRSNSDRITMFDICGGNTEKKETIEEILSKALLKANFQMCKHSTNPINFLTETMGVSSIFRFILSHPDMDHLDGFDNLIKNISVINFWDSGVKKDKPDFKNKQNLRKKIGIDTLKFAIVKRVLMLSVLRLVIEINTIIKMTKVEVETLSIFMLPIQISLMRQIILKIRKQ